MSKASETEKEISLGDLGKRLFTCRRSFKGTTWGWKFLFATMTRLILVISHSSSHKAKQPYMRAFEKTVSKFENVKDKLDHETELNKKKVWTFVDKSLKYLEEEMPKTSTNGETDYVTKGFKKVWNEVSEEHERRQIVCKIEYNDPAHKERVFWSRKIEKESKGVADRPAKKARNAKRRADKDVADGRPAKKAIVDEDMASQLRHLKDKISRLKSGQRDIVRELRKQNEQRAELLKEKTPGKITKR